VSETGDRPPGEPSSSSTPATPEVGLPGFRELDEASLEKAVAIGVDSGATLVKLAIEDSSREIHFGTWPSPSIERVLALLQRLAPVRLGVTGCGTRAVTAGLDRPVATPLEFDAWGLGANRLLAEAGHALPGPYLLVSIGTGTSALRVDGESVERVGGSALGGGTALGLGLALTGCKSHQELAHLAARGRRGGVDLLISDIYGEAEIPIAGEATASSFGKLARRLDPALAAVTTDDAHEPPAPEDLAAAIMGLVAENIALICNAHATAAGVSTIVYGGSTLTENPLLVQTVRVLTQVLGQEALVLPESGHAGALGAMLLSE
jgi:type II pantothenate kinase